MTIQGPTSSALPPADPVETLRITTVSDLVKQVTASQDQTLRPLFRGHEDPTWSLTAALFRIKQLSVLANTWPKLERELLAEFKRRAIAELGVHAAGFDDLDWIAIGRHHGLPTRLLDWSESVLIAAWFATQRAFRPELTEAVIWEIRTSGTLFPGSMSLSAIDRSIDGEALYKLFPRHVTSRLTAQSGAFTVHQLPTSADPIEPLERRVARGDTALRLRRFVIPKESVRDVRLGLHALGITPASLFPDLEGMASAAKTAVSIALSLEKATVFPEW